MRALVGSLSAEDASHSKDDCQERGISVDYATVHRWAIEMVQYFMGASTPLTAVGEWTKPKQSGRPLEVTLSGR